MYWTDEKDGLRGGKSRQEFCLQHPIAVVRGIASALKLGQSGLFEVERPLDWFICGFSPRKANLTLYIPGAVENTALLKKLGKHKTSKACLYINSLADVDVNVVKELISNAVKNTKG